MSIKFPISAVAIATVFTLAYSAIANAESYKTKGDQVVITGMKAKQSYPVSTVNAKGKANKRKPVAANGCGEILVDGAGKMKSLVVGTETIDPAILTVKEHPRCKAVKTAGKGTNTKKAKVGTASTTTVAPAMTTPAASPTTKP